TVVDNAYTLTPAHDHPPTPDIYRVISTQNPAIGAILIEVGNIDDRQEREALLANPRLAATAIANGIEQFIETAYPNREQANAVNGISHVSLNIEQQGERSFTAIVGEPTQVYAGMNSMPTNALEPFSNVIALGAAIANRVFRG
ncbi:MAG: hypothetical protein J0L97_08095, partial [Alphaproteobacteria bacterium]|nr:hypothetical protein [Alphaproteobacteria bacterium]